MSFLPKTKRQKHTLFVLILLMPVIAIEIYFGAQYATERENDFRAFRWDSQTLWKLKPGYHGEAFGRPIHVNPNGFRGSPSDSQNSDTALRVITLGDSRTYGYEVPDDATYSHVMQQRLHDLRVEAHVMNAGTHGYSSVQARAKLEQSLDLDLDVAVFAPGYNDRRYTVVRPPDSRETFATIAMTRQILSVLEWSNTFFAFLQELGKAKLEEFRTDPPPLNEVNIRVPPESFEAELKHFVQVCRDNEILPVFLILYADPYVYQEIEEVGSMVDAGEYEQALSRMEELYPELHNHAHMLYRLYQGRCYTALGEPEKAHDQFTMHTPTGSLHGEAVLRRQELYFERYRKVAQEENVLLVDSQEKIKQASGDIDPETYFRKCFVDECHYDVEGHKWIGRGVAEELVSVLGQTN